MARKKIVHETFLPHMTVDLAASGPQNIEYYGGSDGKESAWFCRRKWQPTPLFLPGESHGQRSLEGYGLRGLKESDTSEQLSLPLHVMIFRSKLTVIIKFFLNIKKKKKKRICLECRRPRFNPWVRKISWRRKWQPAPVLLPREFHGQSSLVGYSAWGHERVGHH